MLVSLQVDTTIDITYQQLDEQMRNKAKIVTELEEDIGSSKIVILE